MKRVKSVEHLSVLAKQRRAVVAPNSWGLGLHSPRPAAFLINWPAFRVLKVVEDGLFIYEPKKKDNKK